MTRLPYILRTLVILLLLSLISSAAFAQNPSRESQDRLYKIMSAQAELTEDDVKVYLQHAEAIFKLRFEPDKLDETVRLIGSWSDKRFAYVTTKLAAGMSLLIKPDDPRNNSIPEFARPTGDELRLIQRYQLQLESAMAQAQRTYVAD